MKDEVHLNSKQWQPCPRGTIQELVDSQSIRSQVTNRRTILGMVFGMAVVGVVARMAGPVGGEYLGSEFATFDEFGETITCTEVHLLLKKFADNQLNDSKLRRRIGRHLSHCDACRQAIFNLADGLDGACNDAPVT